MKRIIALTLILLLLLALCACGDEKDAPSTPTALNGSYVPSGFSAKPAGKTDDASAKPENTPTDRQESAAQTPTLQDKFAAKWEPASQEAQQFSNDAGTSIDVLREEITNAGALFGVGYVGCLAYIEETGIDFSQWYYGASAPLAAQYPFVSEIDAAHTIGEAGHLYCILAESFESSIEVTSADGETLYRAENGDPILLFCNRDGDAQTADITVTVTTPDGTVCTYAPTLDELGFPQLLIGDERQLLSWIIQPAEESTVSFDALLAEGWLGMAEYGLVGDDDLDPPIWSVYMWDEEKQTTVNYSLSFFPNPPVSAAVDGEVVMQCFYENVSGVQAEWEGWWKIETELDQPSVLQLDLMLMRGDDKAHYEAVPTLSESFWAMIHPNGEIFLLIPQHGYSSLPFMGEGVPGVELMLSMG